MNTAATPSFELTHTDSHHALLKLHGDWCIDTAVPSFAELRPQLESTELTTLDFDTSTLGLWDSGLMSFLYQCYGWCGEHKITLQASSLPAGAQRLLDVSTAVPARPSDTAASISLGEQLNPLPAIEKMGASIAGTLQFLGEVTLGFGRLFTGRANSRREDFQTFMFQVGPGAIGIITLTSFLVGMILAYLGAAQLAQFGAQIYVADLVSIGMLREMGALMTAVVLAGRTGAAYAAQLGTMQTREEIDAIVTLGISPIDFLVLPRITALVIMMPLLTLYANAVGMLGGALVAAGMDVNFTQFIGQAQGAIQITHISVGLIKSLVFGLLIAIAGCRAGMLCGRSSAAVGQAATEAVVISIVYLIIADAGFNILFQQLEI